MKIRLMSDLHLEFKDLKLPVLEADKDTVLVLAGDIGVGTGALNFITRAITQFRAVVYVLGNHEFYHKEMNDVIADWRLWEQKLPNFYFLHNDTQIIDDVTFIGTPLWTDLKNEDYFEMQMARKGINDFFIIKYNGQRLTPEKHVELYKEAKEFLIKELEKARGKRVVVTHWLPSWALITERFVGKPLNGFFAANMDHIIAAYSPDFWFFGHTHDSISKKLGGTQFVCNPRGYHGHELNPSFHPSLVIEV